MSDFEQAQRWSNGIIRQADNREDDFYPTPERGTKALLSVEKFEGEIWEPACGDGAISKVLEAAGYSVRSTDLVDRGYGTPRIDFLMEQRTSVPNIITNPPFKLAEEFVAQSLRFTTRKVAILARLAWLEGVARKKLFEGSPLARVWVFSSRLKFNIPGRGERGMIAFAWFVWDHAHKGPPTLGWLHPGEIAAVSRSVAEG